MNIIIIFVIIQMWLIQVGMARCSFLNFILSIPSSETTHTFFHSSRTTSYSDLLWSHMYVPTKRGDLFICRIRNYHGHNYPVNTTYINMSPPLLRTCDFHSKLLSAFVWEIRQCKWVCLRFPQHILDPHPCVYQRPHFYAQMVLLASFRGNQI